MRTFSYLRVQRVAIGVFALALAVQIHAAVTNVAWYRLGENDPGARSELPVTNTTTDFVGVHHLPQFGGPLYSRPVSTNAAAAVGSVLAVEFNGTSQYLSNAVVSTAVNNFGLEAWVKPNATAAGNRTIVFNGSPTVSGWGFIQHGGVEYNASLGGVTSFGSGTASVGTWAHLALVRDNGTTTFYVNGIVSGTSASAPIPAATNFIVGVHPQLLNNTWFNGAVDEVRVFTFAPGQFSTNDLSFNMQRVVTLPASAFTQTNVTLNGSANSIGLPTSAWFEWGATTNYGNVTPAQPFSTGSTNFSQTVGGLASGSNYHFRAVASNSLSVARGANRSFTPAGHASIRRLTNGPVEMNFTGDAVAAYLIEGSTNLIQWKLIAALHATNNLARFQDPEAGQFTQRFYRYRTFPALAQTHFNFPDVDITGYPRLFQQPAFSFSTVHFINTATATNFTRVTNSFPSGGPTTNGLHVSWVFADNVVNPWLRLTTSDADRYPNPILDFSQGFCFDIYADRDFYVVLGLRETDSAGAIGTDGGITGPIEWVGATANNSVSPPRGRLIIAGQWHRVCFWVPEEPVRAFTGNGVLTSTTGKGVLEHLALVPVNYVAGVTNHVFLGNFQTVQRIP